MQPPEEPQERLRFVVNEGFNERNREAVRDAFADEIDILLGSYSDTIAAEELWQEFRPERAGMPDYSRELIDIWTAEDSVFAQYVASGTFENPVRYGEDVVFEPNGKEVTTAGIIMARLEDGQFTAWAEYSDRLNLFQQMEIVPPMKELSD